METLARNVLMDVLNVQIQILKHVSDVLTASDLMNTESVLNVKKIVKDVMMMETALSMMELSRSMILR